MEDHHFGFRKKILEFFFWNIMKSKPIPSRVIVLFFKFLVLRH